MRWIRYEHAGNAHYGMLRGDVIVQVDGAPFAGGARPTGREVQLAEVRLLAPVQPVNFFAAGQPNHVEHVRKYCVKRGLPFALPQTCDFNYRGPNAVIGPDDAVILPADCGGTVQLEGELAIVMGRTAKRVAAKDALDYVFGYTICNDISERNWQFNDRTVWRGKNTDTFNPIGPWIDTDLDLDSLVTHIRVNDVECGSFQTNDMVFGVAELIEILTRNITLQPGDVILTGADEPCPDVRAGDVVEIAIDGLGVLRNRITAEA